MKLKKPIIFFLAVIASLAVVSAGVGLAWFGQNQQPVDLTNQETVRFVIPKGQGVVTIGQRLEEANLIRNRHVFRLLVRQSGYQSRIQAGSFELSPSMTPLEIAEAFTKGSEDIWVTIPEGLRREEIAELFEEFELFDKDEFLTLTATKEGYLYPDTYLFPRAATTEFIVSYLINTFESKTTALQAEVARQGKEWSDTVVLASIVQREARNADQMKMVAGILENRLEIGQALEVDATLQYVKGYNAQTQKWWSVPLAIDKQLASPFNTYRNPGLPPAPIANPGLDALIATVYPTSSDYYFYIHAPDGKMYYGKNYPEHLSNIQKYLR